MHKKSANLLTIKINEAIMKVHREKVVGFFMRKIQSKKVEKSVDDILKM